MTKKEKLAYAKRTPGHRLDEHERAIMFCLVYLPKPVSLDTIISISTLKPMAVLNFMESLKRKKIVREKREFGKGLYFLNVAERHSLLKEVSEKGMQDLLGRVTEFYAHLPEQGQETVLLLADLYLKQDNIAEGIHTIKKAADILYHSGQEGKASEYYNRVVQQFAGTVPGQSESEDYLDSVYQHVSATSYSEDPGLNLILLERAHGVAERYGLEHHQAKIELLLSLQYQMTGSHEKASLYNDHFWELAANIDNEDLSRTGIVMTGAIMVFKGKISDATDYYERTIGGLEKFGDTKLSLLASLMVANSYIEMGRVARGIGMIEAVRSTAQSLGLIESIALADLNMAVALIQLRQVYQAELCLDRAQKALPKSTLDHVMAGAYPKCRAYIECAAGNYEAALKHLKVAYIRSSSVNSPLRYLYSVWPFVLECLYVLESKRLSDKDVNLDSELQRVLSGDNLFMTGTALRYKALRNIDAGASEEAVLSDLMLSERYLNQAGENNIELARVRIVLGNYCLGRGKVDQGKFYLEKAWVLLSGIDKDLFPKDLLDLMPWEQKIDIIIDRISEINRSFMTARDVPSFIERVISAAMDFTMATRGAFLALDGDQLNIIASRNIASDLNLPQEVGLRELIIDAIRKDREIIMPKGDAEDDYFLKLGITSFIGMPVKIGGHPYGYLQLDSQLKETIFSGHSIPFARMLASQAALGLSAVRNYEQVKELKERFEEEATFYRREMGVETPINMIISQSKGIRNVIEQIEQVARTDTAVLISGETGVGKELVAKTIHNLSRRKDGPFIPVNLAALPQDLLESELFGHEKGAFTGAHEQQKGRFELANGGTIFLDEIGDLPLNLQVKLLRVLQEPAFERLGSAKPIQSDFRVLAATNKDLRSEVEKGHFREDLYYRLKVFPIHVPPLRERREDITALTHHFINVFAKKLGKKIPMPMPEEIRKLTSYNWPGNVRELEHVVERSVILFRSGRLRFSGIDDSSISQGPVKGSKLMRMADIEREHIENVLNTTRWRISGPKGAAALLGISRSTLYFRMRKLGIVKTSET